LKRSNMRPLPVNCCDGLEVLRVIHGHVRWPEIVADDFEWRLVIVGRNNTRDQGPDDAPIDILLSCVILIVDGMQLLVEMSPGLVNYIGEMAGG